MRKPLSGAILGILIGVALAIVVQRQGIWPLDQLTLFLMPAVLGLLGLLLLSIGREGSTATMVISLIILLPMAVWGALGFAEINATGELNGGCEVTAASDVDATTVTDTSKQDPFQVDPDGGLTWGATSPTVFTDYEWEIHVVLGGIPVAVDSDTEPNDAGSQVNGGEIGDVATYSAHRGVDIDLLIGVHEVGGFAATCDGFGFVELTSDGLDTISLIALGVILLLIILLIVLMFTARGEQVVESTTVVTRREAADVEGTLDGGDAGSEDVGDDDDFH
ncbi:MAG: hypothetical protein ACRDU9_02390 [Acidimicrobiia bacterium]